MDLIHETLTTYSHNQKYRASIRAAVRLAKKTLNHYYELTDKSEVYHIAMGVFSFHFLATFTNHIIVLHPCHKLSYFKNAGWTEEWINTAEHLVREEFDRSYSILDIDDDVDTEIDEELAGSMDVDSSKVRSMSLLSLFQSLMSSYS
jgi:hypothetical protein